MSLAMISATAHAASRRKAALPTVSALVAILGSYIGELARILRGAQLLVQISTALRKARYLANLWNCPRSTAQGPSWWCGHEELQPCQSSNGHFVNYLSGAIRVRASTTATLSSPMNSASEYGTASGVAATNVSIPPDRASATSNHAANQSDNNSTTSPVPSSTGSSHIAMAIGFGVGVPLGVAALGFWASCFIVSVGEVKRRSSYKQVRGKRCGIPRGSRFRNFLGFNDFGRRSCMQRDGMLRPVGDTRN
ncbi:MAG: hypothetical protein M1830_000542 [Pleopsidium flavum]|nr:MAG: hypothetical protein M1830_000542 [Pleopsidium flavum]